jgi:dsRNA-specific ribonuclease
MSVYPVFSSLRSEELSKSFDPPSDRLQISQVQQNSSLQSQERGEGDLQVVCSRMRKTTQENVRELAKARRNLSGAEKNITVREKNKTRNYRSAEDNVLTMDVENTNSRGEVYPNPIELGNVRNSINMNSVKTTDKLRDRRRRESLPTQPTAEKNSLARERCAFSGTTRDKGRLNVKSVYPIREKIQLSLKSPQHDDLFELSAASPQTTRNASPASHRRGVESSKEAADSKNKSEESSDETLARHISPIEIRKSFRESESDLSLVRTPDGGDAYIFNPYNSVNTQITSSDVKNILGRYGISAPITNFELYRRAFVHRSYVRHPDAENTKNRIIMADAPPNAVRLSTKSNERLEFIGDGILECITKYYLYRRFPKENEGFMTEKKIALVKNEAIGGLAHEMGLHKWFILSAHAEMKGTRTNLKKLGCLFEAFIGALFLDFNKVAVDDEHGWFKHTFITGPGFQMAQIFIEAIFEKHVDWDHLIRHDDNYKNILQVIIQKAFKTTPDYLQIDSPSLGFSMGVYLCLGQHIHTVDTANARNIEEFKSVRDVHAHMVSYGRVFILLGSATHRIKKCAEQAACQKAIENIGTW